MDRSTYDKMKYGNFHLLIGILLVFMLYQSADYNLSYLRQCSLHSLVKLFAGRQDWGRRVKKAETKPRTIHSYQCQISEKNIPTNFQSCIV